MNETILTVPVDRQQISRPDGKSFGFLLKTSLGNIFIPPLLLDEFNRYPRQYACVKKGARGMEVTAWSDSELKVVTLTPADEDLVKIAADNGSLLISKVCSAIWFNMPLDKRLHYLAINAATCAINRTKGK